MRKFRKPKPTPRTFEPSSRSIKSFEANVKKNLTGHVMFRYPVYQGGSYSHHYARKQKMKTNFYILKKVALEMIQHKNGKKLSNNFSCDEEIILGATLKYITN